MNQPCRTLKFLLLAMVLLWPGLGYTLSGDVDALEPGLKSRTDVLFFGAFESNSWTSSWGMDWGPEPMANIKLVEGAESLEGHSLRIRYPKGAFGGGGGCQFLTDFSRLSIAPQESLYLRYYVRFDPGFDFVKGGKLPGLAGGKGNTGGHKPNGKDGWSARIMWRADGKIVQYVYHPDQPGDYGEDFVWDYGGCPRYFKPGQWHCVETLVKMNSPGKKDGIIRSWLDGDEALEVTNLRFRDIPEIKIDKLEFETFFGGGDASWATPRDQFSMFDNLVIAKNYIGPDKDLVAKTQPPLAISPTVEGESGGNLVFDGDHPAWTTSSWSQGHYDFQSESQNHTSSGTKSVYVEFPSNAWGGVQFEGPLHRPADYQNVSLWVYPTGCNAEFRVRFELNRKQVGSEKAVTGSRGWVVNQWNQVILPLAEFQIPDSFNKIVLTSNSSHAVAPFYVDDLYLKK